MVFRALSKQEQEQKRKLVVINQHGAFRSWLALKDAGWKRGILSLRRAEDKGRLIVFIALIMTAVMGAWFTGLAIDHFALQPQIQYTGVCPPPAIIEHGGCYTVTVQGTITESQAAGYVLNNTRG